MKDLSVALAQVAPRLGDLPQNLELHLETAERARQDGADWVVFPELSLTGYLLRDQVPEVALERDSAVLQRLARASAGIDVVAGFVERGPDSRLFNAAGFFSRGRLVHVHRKLYLPTYGMFQEGRDFASGESLRAFDTAAARTGLLVCEDAWHSTTSWLLSLEGAEVLIVPSSGPTRGARPDRGVTSLGVWRQLLTVTAQFQTSYVVYVNRVGCEDGLIFGGGSMVVDPFGRVATELAPLEEALRVVRLEGEVLRRSRAAYPLLRDTRIDLVGRELERIRRIRYELPDEPAAADDEPGAVAPGTTPGTG